MAGVTGLPVFYVRPASDVTGGHARLPIMEMLYFTVAAVLLYLLSDWILNRIEIRRGKRFEHRSMIFFVIILVLSLALFNLLQQLQPATPPEAGGHVQQGSVNPPR